MKVFCAPHFLCRWESSSLINYKQPSSASTLHLWLLVLGLNTICVVLDPQLRTAAQPQVAQCGPQPCSADHVTCNHGSVLKAVSWHMTLLHYSLCSTRVSFSATEKNHLGRLRKDLVDSEEVLLFVYLFLLNWSLCTKHSVTPVMLRNQPRKP